MINSGHAGRDYRYTYAATGKPGWFLFDGLVSHDLKTGTEERFAFGDGVYGSETAMAPRESAAAAEDDGYLVTLTTDMTDDASYCLVFDAARVADGPVCKLQLPERISSGTHSTWVTGRVAPLAHRGRRGRRDRTVVAKQSGHPWRPSTLGGCLGCSATSGACWSSSRRCWARPATASS